MSQTDQVVNATVTSVFPNRVKIEIKDIDSFKVAGEKLSVGSYLVSERKVRPATILNV